MNRTNIQSTINILKRAENFNMGDFQALNVDSEDCVYATNEVELHTCGNSACIAGYVAVSPEWAAVGGRVESGIPVIRKLTLQTQVGATTQDAINSMVVYWGLKPKTVAAIVNGAGYSNFIKQNNLKDLPTDYWDWSEMTKEQAIHLLEQIMECVDTDV
jgi:hypothetical protein